MGIHGGSASGWAVVGVPAPALPRGVKGKRQLRPCPGQGMRRGAFPATAPGHPVYLCPRARRYPRGRRSGYPELARCLGPLSPPWAVRREIASFRASDPAGRARDEERPPPLHPQMQVSGSRRLPSRSLSPTRPARASRCSPSASRPQHPPPLRAAPRETSDPPRRPALRSPAPRSRLA